MHVKLSDRNLSLYKKKEIKRDKKNKRDELATINHQRKKENARKGK